MTKAYRMESEMAIYPRIIVEQEVINLACCYSLEPDSGKKERKIVESLLKKDSDELYYIDYIDKGAYEIEFIYLQEYRKALNRIIERNSECEDIKIKQKIGWLGNKYSSLFKKKQKTKEEQPSMNHLKMHSLNKIDENILD